MRQSGQGKKGCIGLLDYSKWHIITSLWASCIGYTLIHSILWVSSWIKSSAGPSWLILVHLMVILTSKEIRLWSRRFSKQLTLSGALLSKVICTMATELITQIECAHVSLHARSTLNCSLRTSKLFINRTSSTLSISLRRKTHSCCSCLASWQHTDTAQTIFQSIFDYLTLSIFHAKATGLYYAISLATFIFNLALQLAEGASSNSVLVDNSLIDLSILCIDYLWHLVPIVSTFTPKSIAILGRDAINLIMAIKRLPLEFVLLSILPFISVSASLFHCYEMS